MVGAVNQRGLDAEHREACQRTGGQNAFDTLLNARNIFLRNGTADDLGFEYEILAIRIGFENDLDARELTRTTRLLLVGVVFLVSLAVIVSR